MFASVNGPMLGMPTSFTMGGWFENNDFNQARRFYGYTSRTTPGRDHLKFQRDPFFTQWDVDFNTKTYPVLRDGRDQAGRSQDQPRLEGLLRSDNRATPIVAGGRTGWHAFG